MNKCLNYNVFHSAISIYLFIYFFIFLLPLLLNLPQIKINKTVIVIGPQRIWTAGEFEHDTRKKRHSEGGVVVPPVLLRDMQALRDYLPGMKEKYEKLCFE